MGTRRFLDLLGVLPINSIPTFCAFWISDSKGHWDIYIIVLALCVVRLPQRAEYQEVWTDSASVLNNPENQFSQSYYRGCAPAQAQEDKIVEKHVYVPIQRTSLVNQFAVLLIFPSRLAVLWSNAQKFGWFVKIMLSNPRSTCSCCTHLKF